MSQDEFEAKRRGNYPAQPNSGAPSPDDWPQTQAPDGYAPDFVAYDPAATAFDPNAPHAGAPPQQQYDQGGYPPEQQADWGQQPTQTYPEFQQPLEPGFSDAGYHHSPAQHDPAFSNPDQPMEPTFQGQEQAYAYEPGFEASRTQDYTQPHHQEFASEFGLDPNQAALLNQQESGQPAALHHDEPQTFDQSGFEQTQPGFAQGDPAAMDFAQPGFDNAGEYHHPAPDFSQHEYTQPGFEQQSYDPNAAAPGFHQSYEQGFEQPGQDGQFTDPQFNDPQITDQVPPQQMAPAKKSRAGMILSLVFLFCAAGVGTGAAFVYKQIYAGADGAITNDGKPPVVLSDKTPLKQRPTNPGGKQFGNRDKKVFDRLKRDDGKAPSAASRVRFSEQRPAPASAPTSGGGIPGISLGGVPGFSVGNAPTPTPPATRPAAAPRVAAAPSRPTTPKALPTGVRKVPTVAIRPDGTLAPPKPLNTPAAAKTRTAAIGTPSGLTLPAGGGSRQAATPAAPRVLPKPAAARPAPKPSPRATRPQPRVQTPPRQTASLPPRTTQRPAPRQRATAGGGFIPQISARRTRLDALSAFADLQQRYASVLGAATPDIQRVDLGSRGTWYRVRVGPPRSKGGANQLCSKLKQAGLRSCFVRAY